MHRVFLRGLFLISFITLIPLSSWALSLNVYGVGSQATLQVNNGSWNPSAGIGAGAGLEVGTGVFTSLEIGANLLNRKFSAGGESVTAPYLQFPVLFRYWASRFFTLGFGGYYAKANGKVKVAGGTKPGDKDFSEFGLNNSDGGLLAAAGINIPIYPFVRLAIEGRYNFGLYNVSQDTSSSAKFNELQGFVGFRIGN